MTGYRYSRTSYYSTTAPVLDVDIAHDRTPDGLGLQSRRRQFPAHVHRNRDRADYGLQSHTLAKDAGGHVNQAPPGDLLGACIAPCRNRGDWDP